MRFSNIYQLFQKALFSKPYHLNAATAVIGAIVQTIGTGLNDLTSGGTYTATIDHVYTIIIDANGTPDTFKWKKDNGSFTTGVAITGSAQTLADGVQVTFAATTGHTIGNAFTITAKAGVRIASAGMISDIVQNQVGSGAELKIFDGQDSTGTLLYDSLTANWTNGSIAYINKVLQNNLGAYLVLYASSTYPDLIIGYN